MTSVRRSYLELHFAALLFGFTAILGDLISLSALTLVWWRVLLTALSLLVLIRFGRTLRGVPRKTLFSFMGVGVLVALHWICFFGSVKLANPSIALVCMATTSFFTSILEPFFTRRPLNFADIALGIVIIPGMVLIANSAELGMMPGLWVGLAAAFLIALFATLNKMLVGRLDELSVTFLEMSSAWLVIGIALPFVMLSQQAPLNIWPHGLDWLWLLILSLLCTTLGYVLALRSLRNLTAFAANLTFNLEFIYGILVAWFLLDDARELNLNFIWGALIILTSVFIHPLLKKREARRSRPLIQNKGK
ncbi:MAG TPA: DMT family transporter [Flavilitoribacter sp.]|nr:DMT family transporter [Flavilitoribacter sp.]HMQ88565.1 DMT family transporter [Flavilitoribacter sp.]